MLPALSNHLRSLRQAQGLSQTALARQTGISRQALAAIEGGKQSPSTTVALKLARALGCSVEAIFQLRSEGREQVLSPEKLAAGTRVVVGDVGGKLVAHALRQTQRKGDALVKTPAPNASGSLQVERLTPLDAFGKRVFLAGCAPLLGLLCQHAEGPSRAFGASWLGRNNREALGLLMSGQVHIAGVHLDASSSLPWPSLDAPPACLRFHVAHWRQGLVVASGNPLGLQAHRGLDSPELRWATREAGSGAANLLRRTLAEQGLDADMVLTGALRATTHEHVAQLVALGAADVGIAMEAAALAHGLDFLPLAEESYELLVPQSLLSQKPVTGLLESLQSRRFAQEAAHVQGYDLRQLGEGGQRGDG